MEVSTGGDLKLDFASDLIAKYLFSIFQSAMLLTWMDEFSRGLLYSKGNFRQTLKKAFKFKLLFKKDFKRLIPYISIYFEIITIAV